MDVLRAQQQRPDPIAPEFVDAILSQVLADYNCCSEKTLNLPSSAWILLQRPQQERIVGKECTFNIVSDQGNISHSLYLQLLSIARSFFGTVSDHISTDKFYVTETGKPLHIFVDVFLFLFVHLNPDVHEQQRQDRSISTHIVHSSVVINPPESSETICSEAEITKEIEQFGPRVNEWLYNHVENFVLFSDVPA